MKSKVFVIPASGLVYNTVIEVDVLIQPEDYVLDGKLINESSPHLYPKQILIDNNSNSTVGYITLGDSSEYSIYEQKPQWYDFIPIRSKVQANAPIAPKTFKVLIKPLQDKPYHEDVTIICMGYIRQ
jgi:hypothetical protein